jgi:hypothetical protein
VYTCAYEIGASIFFLNCSNCLAQLCLSKRTMKFERFERRERKGDGATGSYALWNTASAVNCTRVSIGENLKSGSEFLYS